MLFIPAVAGYLFHFPLYYLIDVSIKNKASDHYDSIMIGILFFLYPLYVLIITLAVFFITHQFISFFLLLGIPLTALACCILKGK